MFFNLFYRFWCIQARPPKNPDIIVPPDYAMDDQGNLSVMTLASLQAAMEYAATAPSAKLVFANSDHCFRKPGSGRVIAALKRTLLERAGFDEAHAIDAGDITNSVTEAWAVLKALRERHQEPKEILLAPAPLHCRGLVFIWQEVFPQTYISLLPYDGAEWQQDHVFLLQRGPWRWLLANVLRQWALKWKGLDWVAKKQHRGRR